MNCLSNFLKHISAKRLIHRAMDYYDFVSNSSVTIYPEELEISSSTNERVIVLAPHADDETFGCGGTISLHNQAGHQIRVVCLSDNADSINDVSMRRESKVAIRYKEFVDAMKELNIKDYCCLHLSEEDFNKYSKVIAALESHFIVYLPDILYVPSVFDNHHDHRLLHQITYRLFKTHSGFRPRIRMYEIWSTIFANKLGNISNHIQCKIDAMMKYQSQIANIDYIHHILGLNAYRAMTLGNKSRYAEAFFETDTQSYLRFIEKYLSK